MKNILWVGMFVLSLSAVTAQDKGDRNRTKEMQKKASYEFVRNMVENGSYTFIADRAIAVSGMSRSLITTPNSVFVDQGEVDIHLPYYGVVRSAAGYNYEAGIKYKGPAEDYQVTHNDEKRRTVVEFKVKSGFESHRFIITIGKSKQTRVLVISSGRDSITFYGLTRPGKEGSDF